jgi:hypothetical protein
MSCEEILTFYDFFFMWFQVLEISFLECLHKLNSIWDFTKIQMVRNSVCGSKIMPKFCQKGKTALLMKYRRTIKEFSPHDRQLGVTSLERLQRKRMMKLVYLAAMSLKFTDDWETYFRASEVFKYALREYMMLASAPAIEKLQKLLSSKVQNPVN